MWNGGVLQIFLSFFLYSFLQQKNEKTKKKKKRGRAERVVEDEQTMEKGNLLCWVGDAHIIYIDTTINKLNINIKL